MAAVVALLLALLAINGWATAAILRDSIPTRSQKRVQFVIVWVLPFVGALITLGTKRGRPERMPDSTYESAPGGDSGLEELGRIIAQFRHEETIDLIHVPPDRTPPAVK